MKQKGFSLVELMIACVVVGILASIAVSGYTSSVRKARRADAKAALSAISQQLERYYTQKNTYATATLGSTGIYATTSKNGYYILSLPSAYLTASTYKIVATPTGAQTADECGNFILDEQGNQSVSSGTTTDATQCW